MFRDLYTKEQLAFQADVRDFVASDVTPHLAAFAQERTLSRELWRAAGARGLLGVNAPEEWGGRGLTDYRYTTILAEELARASIAVSSSVVAQVDIVIPYLVDHGTPEQKSTWLPGLCSGEQVSAIALTEPNSGSDLARVTTTAERDGDDYIITGSKTFVTNGYSADLVILAARTSPGAGAHGITLFLVDTATHGFGWGRKLDKVGLDEADTAELYFEQMRVPASAVLGDLDGGFGHMMTDLVRERVCAAAQNVAHASQILDETLEYVRRREAFGNAIGSFQYNKFVVADLVTRIEVTQAYVDRCVELYVRGGLPPADSAKAKWWSAEVQNAVIDQCVQLHGGYGYMNDLRVGRAWRDARVTKIWAGTNEIMKEIIGRDLGL
jgi:alkylation response protein AidB-like acyl-CoA dehydrogenase